MVAGKTIQAITLIVANRPPKTLLKKETASRVRSQPPLQTQAASPPSSPGGASSDDFEDVEVVGTVTAAEREHAAKAAAVDLQDDLLCKPAAAAAAAARAVAVGVRPSRCGATLVICPVAALMQWKHEIEKHLTPGTLDVYLYHGPKRTKDPTELGQHDVVLT